MALLVDQLIQTLENIKGNGYFVASGSKDFIPMGLEIKGVDEISFPIAANQAKAMIKVAHKAPFGKGSQTIVDANVRSAWEIDASKISFKNAKWAACLEDMLKYVKVGLGLDEKTVSANLYKLLIYEQGDFFLPHKDSEKEAGMFGTLIVGLPSKHSGGALHVRFNKQEQIIDFSDSENEYKFPFTAFYADCEHEVKPLESGYRICLVYNLIQKKGEEKIRIEDTSQYIEQLSEQLEQIRTHKPMVVLLGHQYTPSNFSLDTLKYHDRPRAEALFAAADKAGLYAKLGLLTCYTHGDLVQGYTSRKKKSRYYDDFDFDEDDGIMGDDIYDEHIVINHWGTGDAFPALSDLAFDEDEILSNLELRDGEPIEKQAEGYTGNAGMTMEYWYHYGAVVFWPQKEHFNILSQQNISSKLDWFKYYLNHWNPSEMEGIKKILRGMIETPNGDKHKDPDSYDALVSMLIKLNDSNFMASPDCQTLLVNIFNKINVKLWVELIESFDLTIFEDIFGKVAELKKIKKIKHLTDVLKALRLLDSSNIQAFVDKQIAQLPNYLNDFDLPQKATNRTYYYYEKEKETPAIGHLKNVLDLSLLKNDDNAWLERMTLSLTNPLTREYVNTILSPLLLSLEHSEKLVLAQFLATVCKKDLIARTNIKPTPPTDWSREVPKPKYQKDVWDMLTPFLTSPTERVFDYSKSEAYRKQVESAISNVTIDIRMETIRKGSPHTLRLTKTQAAYEKELKFWHEDVALLEKIERFYPL